jgi:3-oxoacyl-[acyl-carrier protein] reductase
MPRSYQYKFIAERISANAADASPNKRVGEPKDIGNVAIFLASEEARWISGRSAF